MPVAEPSGEYTVTCSVDLSPLFGKIVSEQTITITRPPNNILDQRLAELRSDDEQTSRTAAYDLAYFEDDGERVFPALRACFGKAEGSVKSAALSSMRTYTEQIAKHPDFFLEIVGNGKLSESDRSSAARYLAWHAPIDARIQKTLEETAEALKDTRYGQSITYYLEYYERRKKDVTD